MSEYITVQPEYSDDPDVLRLVTNLSLAPDGSEAYADREEGDEGSPLAQALFGIDGLLALDLDNDTLVVRRDPDTEWPALIDDISAVLKDFFL